MRSLVVALALATFCIAATSAGEIGKVHKTQRQLDVDKMLKYYRAKVDIVCDVCVVIVEDLAIFLEDPHTEEEIIAFAQTLCEPFGWLWIGFEEMCDYYLEGHLPLIIDNIVNNHLTPDNICTDVLGLCEPATPSKH